jgi:hypothetical protein
MKVGEQIAEVIQHHETDSLFAIDQAAAMLEMVVYRDAVRGVPPISCGMKQARRHRHGLGVQPLPVDRRRAYHALYVTHAIPILEMINALNAKRDTP